MWVEHPDLTSAHSTKGTEEHPHIGAASIWLLEQIQRLSVLPCTDDHHLFHNQFAGEARKPTHIMAIHIKEMHDCVKGIGKVGDTDTSSQREG